MSTFETHPESVDDDSQTLRSQEILKAAGKRDLDFDSQRLRNRLRAKMFGVDASPVKIGRFTVLETVGSGGMGVVYAAYDEELDRRVAVKLLHSSGDDDEGSVGKSRLQREAQALAKLSHPNVVQVYEVGTFGGRVFLAMEFLAGSNLRAWLIDEPRPWEEVLRCLIEAGEGLAAAHREGIIHRDFKPANVLFGGDGRVRVVDFGLARASEHARVPQPVSESSLKDQAFSVELTQTGEIMGTPAYMSPEQARREGVDARSDQYSFCVTLYEALFGRRPHRGNSTAEVLASVAEGNVDPPPRNTRVPARILRAMMRGLSAEPTERFATMEALLAELSLPGHSRWRWLGIGAAAVVAVGTYAAMTMASTECPSFESSLVSDWGAEQRASVQAAFVASGAPRADSVAERVTHRLDGYAKEWLEARQDVCEAHRVRHEQSAQLHDQRVACLLERQVELSTLAAVFAEADATMVEQAPQAAAELSSIAECQDFERMSTAAAEPPVPNALRANLAEVRAQYKAGLYDRALSGVEVVIESAHIESARGFEAEALMQQALIQERRRAFGPAATVVEQALDLAEIARNDELAARAWSRLARYQAREGDAALADQSARRARAKVRRLEDGPELLLEVRETLALTDWQAGRHGAAIDQQVLVVAQYREQRGEDDPRTANAERRLANMLGDQGRHQEAQARYQRAREVIARAYGPDHPMVAHVLVDAAIDHRAARRDQDARATFLEAEALFIATSGPEAPALLTVHKALADIALAARDWPEVQRRVDRLMALSEGPEASPTDRPDALYFKAEVAAQREEWQESIDAYREYLALTSKGSLADTYHLHRIGARINLANHLFELGEVDEAEDELRKALPMLEAKSFAPDHEPLLANFRGTAWQSLSDCADARDESPVAALEEGLESWPPDAKLDATSARIRAKLQWTLARHLVEAQPARALELAQTARSALDDDDKKAVDVWLAAQAAPRRRGRSGPSVSPSRNG